MGRRNIDHACPRSFPCNPAIAGVAKPDHGGPEDRAGSTMDSVWGEEDDLVLAELAELDALISGNPISAVDSDASSSAAGSGAGGSFVKVEHTQDPNSASALRATRVGVNGGVRACPGENPASNFGIGSSHGYDVDLDPVTGSSHRTILHQNSAPTERENTSLARGKTKNTQSPPPAKKSTSTAEPGPKSVSKAALAASGSDADSFGVDVKKSKASVGNYDDDDDDDDDDDEDDDEDQGSKKKKKTKQPSADAKARRRNTNAEASRRSRLKRKAVMEKLRERNDELEQARSLYLERIAELQLEVSTLRHAGSIDVARENELLRAEIRKHKMFISSIVRATRQAPQMLLEERVRLLKNGIDSTLGQIVGLIHTSTDWQEHHFTSPAPQHDIKYRFTYQFLPEGARGEEVKRINMRVESFFLDLEAKSVADGLWDDKLAESWQTRKTMKNSEIDGVQREWKTFFSEEFEEALNELGEHLDISTYAEATENEDGSVNKIRALFARTYAWRSLVPSAFFATAESSEIDMNEVRESITDGVSACPIIATSEFSKQLEKAQITVPQDHDNNNEEIRRVDTSVMHGHVLIPALDSSGCPRSHHISVMSLPVGYFAGSKSIETAATSDGGLTDSFARYFLDDCLLLLKEVHSVASNSLNPRPTSYSTPGSNGTGTSGDTGLGLTN